MAFSQLILLLNSWPFWSFLHMLLLALTPVLRLHGLHMNMCMCWQPPPPPRPSHWSKEAAGLRARWDAICRTHSEESNKINAKKLNRIIILYMTTGVVYDMHFHCNPTYCLIREELRVCSESCISGNRPLSYEAAKRPTLNCTARWNVLSSMFNFCYIRVNPDTTPLQTWVLRVSNGDGEIEWLWRGNQLIFVVTQL